MKFITNLKLAALGLAASIGLAASPAMATEDCDFNCGKVTSISAGTTTLFGGQVLAGAGALDADGNFVEDPDVAVTVDLWKDGGSNNMTDLTASGSICGPTCQTYTLNAQAKAWENGGASATLQSNRAGTMYGIANTGTLSTAGNITTVIQTNAPPAE
ncbi:MAG: hypothetical protein RL538_758 [Candidatus Parcubacteria bacterium]|jgi:hypothetical protein